MLVYDSCRGLEPRLMDVTLHVACAKFDHLPLLHVITALSFPNKQIFLWNFDTCFVFAPERSLSEHHCSHTQNTPQVFFYDDTHTTNTSPGVTSVNEQYLNVRPRAKCLCWQHFSKLIIKCKK